MKGSIDRLFIESCVLIESWLVDRVIESCVDRLPGAMIGKSKK